MASWTPASHEPRLARTARRVRGVYYTPPELVRFVCARIDSSTEEKSPQRSDAPRILDPACGAGAFLVEAAERLFRARQIPTGIADGAEVAARLAAVRRSIFGIDIDPAAAHQARWQLAKIIHASAQHGDDHDALAPIAAELQSNIIHADALLDDLPRSFADGSFDVVLGNPPYVNIRQLVKHHGADYVVCLRNRYPIATGNFDLYIPFLQRAWRLLRSGGRCAFVLPNKIAGLGYAAECRRLLLEQTELSYLVDLSTTRAFAAAGVYPWIVAWQKAIPAAGHKLVWQTATDAASLLSGTTVDQVEQSTLQADGFRRRVSSLAASAGLCQLLGDLAPIECGTAGYMAQRIGQALRDAASEESGEPVASRSNAADFIVSGNIDRYSIQTGDVRYLGKRFGRPQLALDDPALTPRQRRLFAQPKIVVSGMTRRLEAAYDGAGLALGVQVYAVLPPSDDVYYILGLLNSRWLSHWFRQQFAAKQLGGGFLGINKAQLTQLPIRVVAGSERADIRRRRAIAEAAEALCEPGHGFSTVPAELDRRLDRLVYELYRLSDAQIAECEAHFAAPTPTRRRAA